LFLIIKTIFLGKMENTKQKIIERIVGIIEEDRISKMMVLKTKYLRLQDICKEKLSFIEDQGTNHYFSSNAEVTRLVRDIEGLEFQLCYLKEKAVELSFDRDKKYKKRNYFESDEEG